MSGGQNDGVCVSPDLIVLDWLIPKLDGISLCRQLRSQEYQQPILLLTASVDIHEGIDNTLLILQP